MRWRAVATCKTDSGQVDVEHLIEELGDIEPLIEAGPDWNALVDIRITLERKLYDVTVEQSESPDFDPFPINGGQL